MKKIAGILLLAVFMLTLVACNSGVSPADYEEYIPLTSDYDYDSLDDVPIDDPCPYERQGELTHVVIHFISNVIANPTNPYSMDEILGILETYGLSVHYIIDRVGTIHFLVPENHVAFHAGAGYLEGFPDYENNLNQHSIGIELLGIGTQEEMAQFLTAAEYNALDPSLIGFTDAQYEALNVLLNDILARNPGIQPNRTHIIGHSEYAPDKPDPGALFEWDRLDFMQNP
ncbi:MAG: N-acetylmuramoyl-L-alanine amidase [Oscillospiraceae bacterium]|nr:N-acetylmuramoyl-L-alanine amidase [Oscillospiraceae bacterium]